MAKKNNIENPREDWLSKLNSTWAFIIAAFTLLMMGATGGSYITNTMNEIKNNELNQKHNEQLYNQQKDFDSKINSLIQEKNLLEIENGKLRKEL